MSTGILEVLLLIKSTTNMINTSMKVVSKAIEENRDLTPKELNAIKTLRNEVNTSFEEEMERRRGL